MAQEQSLPPASDLPAPESPTLESDSAEPSLSRSSSGSRLNARAPEFIPRVPGNHHRHHHHHHHHHHPNQNQNQYQRQHRPQMLMPIHYHRGPPPPSPPPAAAQMMHVYRPQHGIGYHGPPLPPAAHRHGSFEYGDGGGGFVEQDQGRAVVGNEADGNAEGKNGLPDEIVHKVTKQVEYYFSDLNLATTEHLMKFISKDPEGFVPISVITPFKKIRALVNNSSQLAAGLRTSSKLVVSDDGKKVRRQQPITEADLEELQSRIVVAENLPEDHCYQNLVKVFSVVGSVKTIRTCYPQPTNNAATANARPGKMNSFLLNKLHAFVEYQSVEDAERAVAELNDERNWRSGLRVRFIPKNMRHGQGRGRKGAAHGGDGNVDVDDLVAPDQSSTENNLEDHSEPTEASHESIRSGEERHKDRDDGPRLSKGRGRGRGWGRGQHQGNNHCEGGHATPNGPVLVEHITANKQPPGPRMPDGTRGFTMGRGKSIGLTSSAA